MMKRWSIFLLTFVAALAGDLRGLAAAEPSPMVCAEYADTTARTVTADGLNRQFVIAATLAHNQGTFASICFPDSATISMTPQLSQLVIENTGPVTLLIENLTVQQTVVPGRCEADARVCPTVILKGRNITLRNPRVINLRGENVAVDGFAIEGDHMTIEVTPERLADPTYVTSQQFRYGIFGERGNDVTIQRAVIRRTTAQVGSAGVYLTAGTGHEVIDVRVHGVDTAVALRGGAADAANVVLGGTFDGNTTRGDSCNAHAGAFVQGDHAFVRSTDDHPLTLANFQHGVILDPLIGPMGVEGGTIRDATVGVTIRNANVTILPLVATQVTQFLNVPRRFDFGTL